MHGQHVAAVELRQHPYHHAKSDQVAQIDGQKAHQGCVFPFQQESLGGIQATGGGADAQQSQYIGPGISPEGGDNHQQQHHRPGRVEQFLHGVDKPSDRRAEHRCNAGTTACSDNHAAKGHRCFQPAGHLPGHGTTHLHGRAFGTKRETAANGHDASHQFHQAHLQAHRHSPVFQKSHDVGDA